MAQNMSLLIPAYNHFLHYLQLNKYKKELKQKGKVEEEASNKKFNKNCKRLIAFDLQFSCVMNAGTFKFSTSSQNVIWTCWNQSRPTAMMSLMQLSKTLAKTSLPFKMAPKGLPIDFYSPKWFLGLVYSQQQSIRDMTHIGLLPNAKQSLLPKPHTHPDEKLADSTFTKKYWEVVAEPYGLLDLDSSDNEADGSVQHNQSDEEGEGIDLTQPSDGSESDDFYKEGEEGDLYDEEEDGFVVSGSGEGEGEDKNKDDNEYDKAEDGDYTMHEIPEGEEI
ncbi:hypothetical protein VP01_1267g4 [Puccinia sorghi]|uniref:Uncharacterized protein n=1 Tax=Puccinia sorghi TaxID=27349 RepID=A0A0L6VP12_9BASI|nr:hypothetical protein VP01_1267g4 [Puccinia sorghi]